MGKKLVILGNGPSLLDHQNNGDFELLKNVDTFGMNRLHMLFEPDKDNGIIGTDWRPTHYAMFEWFGEDTNSGGFWWRVVNYYLKPKVTKMYIGERFKDRMFHMANGIGLTENSVLPSEWEFANDTVRFMKRCWNISHSSDTWDSRGYPEEDIWHLPVVCTFGGTITAAYQIAFMLGYTDIAVIGCDLGIVPMKNDEGVFIDFNHFHPNYETWGNLGVLDKSLVYTHKKAKEYYEVHGRTIVNAGIGGALEVFDRVKLSDWVGK